MLDLVLGSAFKDKQFRKIEIATCAISFNFYLNNFTDF